MGNIKADNSKGIVKTLTVLVDLSNSTCEKSYYEKQIKEYQSKLNKKQ